MSRYLVLSIIFFSEVFFVIFSSPSPFYVFLAILKRSLISGAPLFENTIAIQFNHRWIAIFSFFWIVASVFYIYYNKITYVQKIACFTVFILATIQVIIGILTLIHNVPISLASMHQMNAVLLYCSLLITYYLFSKKRNI